MLKNKHGFTLVELLVVMAIMSILTVITVSQFGTARMKQRDVKRKADINAMSKAIQMYYADYGVFPEAINCAKTSDVWDEGEGFTDESGYVYMKNLPDEESSSMPPYCYVVNEARNQYALFAALENRDDSDCSESYYHCDNTAGDTLTDYCYAAYSFNISPSSLDGVDIDLTQIPGCTP